MAQELLRKKSKMKLKGILVNNYRNFKASTHVDAARKRREQRERPITQRLGNDLHEVMQFRKRLDDMSKSQRADELLKNKDYYESVERELVMKVLTVD